MLAPGTILGGCRLEAVIGRGGMGVVYRARQIDLDRDVAVKVIAPELVEDEQTRTRFLTEARAAGAVEHPNVVPVHGVGIADGRAYLVMRYVAGDDLRTLVRRDGPLAPDQAADVTAQLGEALDAIHRAGYVHRDVKPQNVMIGANGHVYLSDFGLAKEALATSGPTTSEHWVGTLDYVAPEQIRGRPVDARADVYALGGVLFFMLTGRVPFERPTDDAKLWAHLHDPAPVPSAVRPGLPAGLDAVVERAMAKEPDLRQPSAGDLGRAATAAAAGRAPPRTVTTRLRPVAGVPRRRPARVAAALGVLLAAATGGWLLLRDDPPSAGSGTPEAASTPAAPTPAPTAEPARRGLTVRDVGLRPRSVAVAGGDVWVLSIHEERLARFDPDNGRRVGRQPFVGAGGADMAADRGRVWVAKRVTGGVLGLDAESGALVSRVPVPLPPVHVAAGSTGLWVAGRTAPDDTDVLYRYERTGAGPPEQWEFPDGIAAITLGDGAAWVASVREKRIRRVVPGASRPEHAGWLEDPAETLAYGAGHVWASIPSIDSVARVDPRTEEVVTTDVRGRTAGLAVAGDRVFVAADTQHSVLVLDPRRFKRQPLQRLRVPANPGAMTAAAGHVWVAGIAGNTVARIDY